MIVTNVFSVLFLKTSDTGNKSLGKASQWFTCIAVKGLPILKRVRENFYCNLLLLLLASSIRHKWSSFLSMLQYYYHIAFQLYFHRLR